MDPPGTRRESLSPDRVAATPPDEGERVSMTIIDVGRRSLIKRATAAGLLTVPALTALSACATGGGGGTQQVAEGRRSARNPLGVNESAGLDVVIFDGGFGEEYARAAQAKLT